MPTGAVTGLVAGSALGVVSGSFLDSLDGPAWHHRVVLAVLSSRLARNPAGVADGGLVALAVTGVRTGRVFRFPVEAAWWHPDRLVVLPGHPERKTWWRNLGERPMVEVLPGRRLAAGGGLGAPGGRPRRGARPGRRTRSRFRSVEARGDPLVVLTLGRDQGPAPAGSCSRGSTSRVLPSVTPIPRPSPRSLRGPDRHRPLAVRHHTVYHFLFVPITIGLSAIVAGYETAWVRTGNERWLRLTKFFGKLFLINFAIGVVTGIVQEFQFGMNWSDYSRFVGDVFGAPLAIEGLLAFFLESTFLGLWIFGWDRLPPQAARLLHLAGPPRHAVLGLLHPGRQLLDAEPGRLHATTPTTGRAEMNDFAAVLFNKVQLVTFPHVVLSAYLTGAAFVVGGRVLAAAPGGRRPEDREPLPPGAAQRGRSSPWSQCAGRCRSPVTSRAR